MDELHRLNATYDSEDEPGAQLSGFGTIPFHAARRGARQLRHDRLTSRAPFPLGALVALTVAQLAMIALFSFVGLLLQMTYDGCGSPNPECNFGYTIFALYAVPTVGLAAVIVMVTLMVRPHGLLRRRWWVPIVLTTAPLAGFGLCWILTIMGTGRYSF
ncbi:hypothetical protein [Lacisediminihabitans sp. H27-G8]|uniref:hypothetical protein n=1 Tax=Lacisediminihabitans sp. H27-G8 TaxID=3111909 RepID=UPI0038FC74E2